MWGRGKAGVEPVDVGDGEAALGCVVGRAGGVAFEHADQVAFAGGDDDEVVSGAAGEAVEVGRGDGLVDHGGAAFLGQFEPGRHFEALVDALAGEVELGRDAQGEFAGWGGEGDVEALEFGDGVVPQVEAVGAFGLQGLLEHALGAHRGAAADVVGGAGGDERDVVVLLGEEAEGELEAGLAGAHHEDTAHCHHSLTDSSGRGRCFTLCPVSSTGWVGSAVQCRFHQRECGFRRDAEGADG
jgi:hypothetical protein